MMSPLQHFEIRSRNPQVWMLLTDDEAASMLKQVSDLSAAAEVMYISLISLISHMPDNVSAKKLIESATHNYLRYRDTYSIDEYV